jgi:hypothetical protein
LNPGPSADGCSPACNRGITADLQRHFCVIPTAIKYKQTQVHTCCCNTEQLLGTFLLHCYSCCCLSVQRPSVPPVLSPLLSTRTTCAECLCCSAKLQPIQAQ